MFPVTAAPLVLALQSGVAVDSDAGYWYTVAGHRLVADLPIPALQSFAQPSPPPQEPIRLSTDGFLLPGEMQPIYQGSLWIAHAWRSITCHRHAQGFRLEVEGIGVFAVAATGQAVICREVVPGASPDAVSEAAIGPALILALALQQTWTLHAGAVVLDGTGVAFVGDSGAGKSTLAHYLDGDTESPFHRIADDILPFALAGRSLVCLPHFPQLKLPHDKQPGARMPQQVPLRALYTLDSIKDSLNAGPTVAVETQNPRGAALALVRHTVATRLFDRKLLAHHLMFCTQAGPLLPVRRLIYPRRFDALPAVRDLLLTDLESLPSSSQLRDVS